jgi:hypothetical protein
MLLIKNDKAKNRTRYPTMSMILNGLFAKLVLASIIFNTIGCGKVEKSGGVTRRTHDMIGGKGDRLEKTNPL